MNDADVRLTSDGIYKLNSNLAGPEQSVTSKLGLASTIIPPVQLLHASKHNGAQPIRVAPICLSHLLTSA